MSKKVVLSTELAQASSVATTHEYVSPKEVADIWNYTFVINHAQAVGEACFVSYDGSQLQI